MLKKTVRVLPLLALLVIGTVSETSRTAQAYGNPSITKTTGLSKEQGMFLTKEALKLQNAPQEKLETLTKGVYAAHIATDLDPVLIACIIPSESEFKPTALSPKGYKGLMQTKHSHMNWEYAETDIMEGSCKLREKLKIAKGNLPKALTFYKGSRTLRYDNGKKSEGYKQALEVLEQYQKTKKTLKQMQQA